MNHCVNNGVTLLLEIWFVLYNVGVVNDKEYYTILHQHQRLVSNRITSTRLTVIDGTLSDPLSEI